MNPNEKRYYQGLYGSDEIEFTKGLIHINPFGIIGKQHQNNVLQHAHNHLFQVFLVHKGPTHFLFNTQTIEIDQPTIITVPKNTEHGFEHQTDVDGWIISLSDTVLERMIFREAEVVSSLEDVQIISVENEELLTKEIEHTIQKCVLEYNDNKSGRLLMLEYLVGQLVVQLYRLPQNQKKKLNKTDHSSKIYFRKFTQSIKESTNYKKTIDEYAGELGITAGHLNKICQSVASQSPKEVIMKYFITEAQLLLTDVTLTISEVAYKLNFDDKSYFSRIFKKKTGLTPAEFRKLTETKL